MPAGRVFALLDRMLRLGVRPARGLLRIRALVGHEIHGRNRDRANSTSHPCGKFSDRGQESAVFRHSINPVGWATSPASL